MAPPGRPNAEIETEIETEKVAIRYAKQALGPTAYGHFDDIEIATWDELVTLIKDRWLPADVNRKLLAELFTQKMGEGDYNSYFTRFQAFRQHLKNIDEQVL